MIANVIRRRLSAHASSVARPTTGARGKVALDPKAKSAFLTSMNRPVRALEAKFSSNARPRWLSMRRS